MSKTQTRTNDIQAAIVARLKMSQGLCCFCGRSVDSLVWHHVGPKTKTIAEWKKLGKLDELVAELQMCLPAGERCHNHHHANEKIAPNLPHLVQC